jgi:hypothetical protein
MLEVKWEFEGSDQGRVVQAAVEKVVRRLQRAIGTIVCPVHHLRPPLRIRGYSVDTLDIAIEGCCDTLLDATAVGIRQIRHSRRRNDSVAPPATYQLQRQVIL